MAALYSGVCTTEEIAFQGFLPWYVLQVRSLFGAELPLRIGLGVSTLVFVTAHVYQGWKGVLTGVLGDLFALFYSLTGSLLQSVIAHILLDAHIVLLSPTVLGRANGERN